MSTQEGRGPSVVIVGGGVGGIAAARKLARTPVKVTLVDARNYYLFQPLIYEVAGAILNVEDITHSIRGLLHGHGNARFRLATADWARGDEELRAFQDTIFLQDKPVLESQRPVSLPLDLRAELHTAADKASSFYRRYLKGLGITVGVC